MNKRVAIKVYVRRYLEDPEAPLRVSRWDMEAHILALRRRGVAMDIECRAVEQLVFAPSDPAAYRATFRRVVARAIGQAAPYGGLPWIFFRPERS